MSRIASGFISKRNQAGYAAIVATLLCVASSLPAQQQPRQPCLPRLDYEPVLVSNPQARVTFQCDGATAMDVIRAIGYQTRIPIGVLVGQDSAALDTPKRCYQLQDADAKSALLEASKGTGYSLREENGVLLLTAPDITAEEQQLLSHTFTDFKPSPQETMIGLAAALDMWLQSVSHPNQGYGASLLGSMNDERLTLPPTASTTVAEIASQIVSLGSHGLWMFKAESTSPSKPAEYRVSIEPYQHYSNRPTTETSK